ncbi:hypothetical protein [Bacillus sp. FJAT-45350]|uniref:hypothetical protein n=1 Tax=Bacillus sp. FJAT-45350 TaxID=2011014 RepID=UPI000BB7CB5D|nr:hypothetical protein [Bacillus sp. FJAT-45350]
MTKKSSQQSFAKDSTIQLKQKVIHYRSEVARYQNTLEQYKIKLKKKDENYQVLQNEIEKLKNKEPEVKEVTRIEVQPHFSYSLILPQLEDEQRDVIIMGNFICKNIGNTDVTNPVFCLKVEPYESTRLSGKIKLTPHKNNETDKLFEDSATEEWSYVHSNWKEKVNETGEHWIRPSHQTDISPGGQISFSNFNLTLSPPKKGSSIIVTGFVYFQEIQQGIPALNQIIVNY